MDRKPISIVYFSGTGGTELIAREFAACFSRKGRQSRLLSLDRSEQTAKAGEFAALADTSSLLVVLYPVYMMNAPQPVYDWIAAVPEANTLPTAVVSVSGGGAMWPNNACRVHAINGLTKKGYRVFYEHMMVMPPNCLIKVSDDLAMRLLNAVPAKVETFVSEMLKGKRRRAGIPFASWPVLFMNTAKAAASFGCSLLATDLCTGCGLCAEKCPVGNIRMGDGKPVFGQHCAACTRCYYRCPVHAITSSGFGVPLWNAYDLDCIRERMRNVSLKPVVACAKGITFLGIRKYLRVNRKV